MEDSESEPFFVRSTEGEEGLAKPGTAEPPVHRFPRAAHEKISADLAYELGLPVPPAILWERPDSGARHPRYASISAIAFPRANVWASIPPHVAGRVLPLLKAQASAMAVFDTWLANTDRQNDGNLLVSEDDSVSPPVLRSAYLDFAHSMAWRWEKGERWWKLEDAVACYPDGVPLDATVMGDFIRKVERLPEATLQGIVNRIPDGFLSTSHRAVILEGLSFRQSMIRRTMARVYPGIP